MVLGMIVTRNGNRVTTYDSSITKRYGVVRFEVRRGTNDCTIWYGFWYRTRGTIAYDSGTVRIRCGTNMYGELFAVHKNLLIFRRGKTEKSLYRVRGCTYGPLICFWTFFFSPFLTCLGHVLDMSWTCLTDMSH